MKKLIILSIAVATLLSGCSLISNGDLGQEDLSKSDQTLDNYQFNIAIQSQDAERCEQIVGEDMKAECIKTVDGFKITEQARIDLDSDMCGEIELDRYKANCVFEVEKAIEAAEAMAKYEEEKSADLELQAKASESQDIKMCEQIKMDSMKNSCIYNIVADQAIAASDESLCEQIEDEVMSNECRKSVQLLTE